MERFRSQKTLVALSILGVLALVIAAWYFQPWRLFTNTYVADSIPTSSVESQSDAAPPKALVPSSSQQAEAAQNADNGEASQFPLVLKEGSFISHEYETSGELFILELETGERILRIENLDTSDGPDLEVWLSDAPVIEGLDGWRVFDDGSYLSLGKLKGNLGDQNYEIPAGVDLEDFSSVSIWCVRFAVSFGAAEL